MGRRRMDHPQAGSEGGFAIKILQKNLTGSSSRMLKKSSGFGGNVAEGSCSEGLGRRRGLGTSVRRPNPRGSGRRGTQERRAYNELDLFP